MKKKDTKTIYAQSSDIKSRTYLEYCKDMKQKAIAELKVLPWLREKIKKIDKKAQVEKYGSDKFIWFLRKGGITREPDFIIQYSSQQKEYIEFQYAKEKLKAYDFKISKISPKNKNLKKRIPKDDTKFLYMIKSTGKFAILEPTWIASNSHQTVAPAWGNAPVFKVSKKVFEKTLQKDKKLKMICDVINKKNTILEFQNKTIEIEKEKFSYLLQKVLDDEKILTIIPKTLDGFFKICFTLSHLQKIPVNASLWLIYLLSFLNKHLNSYEIFQMIYSLDFLYSKVKLKPNEVAKLIEGLKTLVKRIKEFSNNNGSFQSDKTLSPLEDTRYSIFAINILEDLTQDILFYYEGNADLKPITRIYQTISNVKKTFEFITN